MQAMTLRFRSFLTQSAVSFRLSTHVGPRGILACAFHPADFFAAGARGKFHVVGNRSLDAAAHGHVDARDMVNIASARHYFPFGRKPFFSNSFTRASNPQSPDVLVA